MRTVDKLIERLALLASGEKPTDAKRGICYDIGETVSDKGYGIFQDALAEMCLCQANPIGRVHYKAYGSASAWTGIKGKLRRDLCKRTVFHLVRVHGYQGDWA